MSTQRDFISEIRNEQIILENLARAGSRGQNAEAVLRSMRKLWSILMDTEFRTLDEPLQVSLTLEGSSRLGMGVAHDLRRASTLERYFRGRGRGFLPYIGLLKGELILLRRGENLDRILSLHELIKTVSERTLEGLERS